MDGLPPNHEFYRGFVINTYFPKPVVDRVLDSFKFRETDIVLATYPRSGTLLTQEIIWQIKNRHIINSGENYGSMEDRFPYIEFVLPNSGPINVDKLENMDESKQRFIKTHIPHHVIYDRIKHCKKIVVVYRDAKDVTASYYNFNKMFLSQIDWPKDFEDFFKYFKDGKSLYGSYFDWNSEWLKLKSLPNIHFLKYEDMSKDKANEIRKLATFLDEGDITDEQVEIILENTSFGKMFSNPEVNASLPNGDTLMRKGIVGNWKEYLNDDQREYLDSMTKKHINIHEA